MSCACFKPCFIDPRPTAPARPSQDAVDALLAQADAKVIELAQDAFVQVRKLNEEAANCIYRALHHIQILQSILKHTRRNRAEAYTALLLLLSTPCS